jgi:predicted AAA+ superfamily ATPase
VLRLMAAVIYALWEREDRSLMILPSSIPIDNGPVQFELVRYLESAWDAVIAHDVDGPTSVPLAIDQEIVSNLGRYSATRRVARTIYMGSAPTWQSKNPGIDDRRIRLGCAQPDEPVAAFGDALRQLADRARFLYVDGPRSSRRVLSSCNSRPNLARRCLSWSSICSASDLFSKPITKSSA